MLREEILYKKSRTGTTIFSFAPNQTPETVPQLQELAYLVFNNYNQPIYFSTYNGKEIWKLNSVYNYQLNTLLESSTNNFVTGYSVTQTINKTLSDSEKETIKQRFNNSVTSTITAQTQIPLSYQTYVFFEQKEIDDMFANIKLSRTYETLDTLKIYNTPINSIPQQEAKTGILFGKLEAIQLLKDDEGNSIRIPLANVPIGIFNPSEEFPTPSSLDENGDRFYMNLSGVSSSNIYFSPSTGPSSTVPIAYSEDQKFLRSNSDLLSLPDKFKFVTITNENGEFVIYNAPVGNQTVVFEVDLFKQGLSKDEIILNNFPFPPSDNANIGEFPCYYYNQVPVDIVPAWGTVQTGYTELDITVNLDLRKWTTYMFAPAAYGKEKLESTTAKNAANTLKIQIRDMTNAGFGIKDLEVVQISDDLDRDNESQYSWYNEFGLKKTQLQYSKFGCHVLKLPANMYDPNGFKTNVYGVPTAQKGVWLSAYQFRVFVNKTIGYRDTGAFKKGTAQLQSHYGLSYSNTNTNFGINNDNSAIGQFPYEKPWSISYPEPYNIPAMPVKQRYGYQTDRTYNSTPYPIEEPRYSDGDLVGSPTDASAIIGDTPVGGFGLQEFNGTRFQNRIAFVASKTYMYKYERNVSWKEKYANGYEPYWTGTGPGGTGLGPWATNVNGTHPLLAGMSSVLNGEKYQRVECGYGYFMKYSDWPLIYTWPWVWDTYFTTPPNPQPNYAGGSNGFGFNIIERYANVYNLDDQNFALALNNPEDNKARLDGIDIYRIVNSGYDNIGTPENFRIPTFAKLKFGPSANRLFALQVWNSGDITVEISQQFNDAIMVGGNSINYNGPVGNEGYKFKLEPGAYFVIQKPTVTNPKTAVEHTELTFPGNSSYNINTNKYENVKYSLRIVVDGNLDSPGQYGYWSGNDAASGGISPLVWNTAATANADNSKWKIVSQPYVGNTVNGITDDGCSDKKKDDRIFHVYIANN